MWPVYPLTFLVLIFHVGCPQNGACSIPNKGSSGWCPLQVNQVNGHAFLWLTILSRICRAPAAKHAARRTAMKLSEKQFRKLGRSLAVMSWSPPIRERASTRSWKFPWLSLTLEGTSAFILPPWTFGFPTTTTTTNVLKRKTQPLSALHYPFPPFPSQPYARRLSFMGERSQLS